MQYLQGKIPHLVFMVKKNDLTLKKSNVLFHIVYFNASDIGTETLPLSYSFCENFYASIVLSGYIIGCVRSLQLKIVRWLGGAMVLGKTCRAGASYSRARTYCAFSRCGWGLFGHFFSRLSFLSSSLSLGDRPI